MADRKPTMLERWRNNIQDQDPQYKCMKYHKKSIANSRPQSRLVIFWSFVSLFYIYGDISIGTRGNQNNSVNEVVVWGIPFFGITEITFLQFISIVTLYYLFKLIFSIVRVHILCNSLMAFKELISLSGYDIRREKHEKRYRSPERPVGISLSVSSGENPQSFDPQSTNPQITQKKDEEYIDNREMWLFMMKYRLMGFLEYFFAPILFPTILALWALFVLAMEVFF